jgi:hypothetical protein
MNTPQTDTPETDAFASQLQGLGIGYYQALDFARKLERQRNAAEAMVKELEAEVASANIRMEDLDQLLEKTIKTRNNFKELCEDLKDTSLHYEAERDEARAALRLRPIAEAGPVPEGMVRVYAERYLNEEWLFAEKPCESDTHCIDIIYPPQQ